MILVKFTFPIVAVLSIASCLQQSNSDAAAPTSTTEASEFADDKIVQQRKLLANFSLASILPPVPKIPLPKLPSIPKRNTITLTTTVLKQATKVIKVYPTCLRLENIHSVCNGFLQTIVPTPILPLYPTFEMKSASESGETDVFYTPKHAISPSATVSISPTQTVEDLSARKTIIEPSEHEYEYKYSSDDSTVELDSSESEPRFINNLLDSVLGPKHKIVTQYLTITKVIQYTDYAHTATIIAQNCLPPNTKYPLCDLEHINPLLQRLKIKITNQAASQIVSNVHDQVNKFVISNPHGLLGISPDHSMGQFYGALNSDGIPSILRTAEQFPMYRSMPSTNMTFVDDDEN